MRLEENEKQKLESIKDDITLIFVQALQLAHKHDITISQIIGMLGTKYEELLFEELRSCQKAQKDDSSPEFTDDFHQKYII